MKYKHLNGGCQKLARFIQICIKYWRTLRL